MADPRGILFDLDNTLVDREASIRRYAPVFHRDFASAMSPVAVERIAEGLIQADSGGYRRKEDMLRRILSWPEWRSPPDPDCLNRHWMWEFPPLAAAMEHMLSTLDNLVGRGIRLGIITNGSARAQNAKIMALHLWKHCSVILVSESAGLEKPDARLFLRGVDGLGLTAEEVWFVGDNPEADVIGAESAGLTGVWMAGFQDWPDGVAGPSLRIRALGNIPALLGG